MQCSTRVSKSCNHAVPQLHKIFENLQHFWTNECETRKLNSCICCNLTKYFNSHKFYLIYQHVSVQNFQSEHFDCKQEFAFRKSVQSSVVYQGAAHCKVPSF